MGIFLDTSFIMDMSVKDEVYNKEARALWERISSGEFGQVYTSDYVFDEVVTLVAKRTKRFDLAANIGSFLISNVPILPTSKKAFYDAWKQFRRLRKLSFTDCTILEVMKANSINWLATFDSDFKGLAKTLP